jgi:predicted dehydrogenase
MTRRHFLAAPPALAAAGNDPVRIALIGAGGRGQGDVRYSLKVPGVKLTAACDVYTGRLERVRELWGRDVFTTRDYREVLARQDVDAVIVAAPDHWHARMSIDALRAGKDVYCQKPMVRRLEDGPPVIEAARSSGRILQVGSQWASSPLVRKAAELVAQGAIGELTAVEAVVDRNSTAGAGQLLIPPDASPDTVDWDRFLGDAPRRPFEPVRAFRWRYFPEYCAGIPGDLYVHLLTGLHTATGALGPSLVFASGALRYWKDGRQLPDVMQAIMQYPRFTLALRVNLACGGAGEEFGLRLVGGEGAIHVSLARLTLWRGPRQFEADYTLGTFAKATRDAIVAAEGDKLKGPPSPASPYVPETFEAPPGHYPHLDHLANFYAAVRTRRPFFEDATFGFRAVAPALLCNLSVADGRVHGWDPVNLRTV